MSRRVVVIASGETERLALPHLVEHLAVEGVDVQDVRIPPRHQSIKVANAEKIIRAVWFERVPSERPDKFVVLLDTDGSRPDEVLEPIRSALPSRLRGINANIQFAYAQRHLEAWYFADANGLVRYLRRDLGNIDPTAPDALQNPKLHLKHLLQTLGSRPYTARVSEEIARQLNVGTIARHSASFCSFIAALRNGTASAPT